MALPKLYMTPGSCTTGIHIILQELDVLFEVYPVNLLAGQHETAEFKALNPKSSIPMLITEEGRVLTEFQAIAWWLGRSYPQAGFLGSSLDDEISILEVMDYVVATVHMQGFARIFTTDKFSPNADEHEAVKQQGLAIIAKAMDIIGKQFIGREYVIGNFSIADAALFYVEFWAVKTNIKLPVNCMAHYQRMLKRPAVRQVLMEEGYRFSGAA